MSACEQNKEEKNIAMTEAPAPSPTAGPSFVKVEELDYTTLVSKSQNEALHEVLRSLPAVGLQATQLGKARLLLQEILYHRAAGDRVFLAYTSNLISSGLRDTFAFLAREGLVDGFISSAGGIEEDVIKCGGSTLLGRFDLDGAQLRRKGINRIGNLLVPNDNYCWFEDFFTPLLRKLHEKQRSSRWTTHTTPSEVIYAMGEDMSTEHPTICESSLLYWCYRQSIPVFCPAFTDGSMGDMIYFYNFSRKGLLIDPVKDVSKLRGLAAEQTSGGKNCAIVLGGGLPKHHLLRNIKMDRVVLVTTGIEADGCTSSGILADDISCGLLTPECEVVRVQGDATMIFPLLMVRGNP